jgi:hypothetical protein
LSLFSGGLSLFTEQHFDRVMRKNMNILLDFKVKGFKPQRQ